MSDCGAGWNSVNLLVGAEHNLRRAEVLRPNAYLPSLLLQAIRIMEFISIVLTLVDLNRVGIPVQGDLAAADVLLEAIVAELDDIGSIFELGRLDLSVGVVAVPYFDSVDALDARESQHHGRVPAE